MTSGALQLQKEVANITMDGTYGANNQAKPGETLSYRITYTNNGNTPLSNVVISDSTDAYTTFVSAAAGITPTRLGIFTKNTPINPLPAAARHKPDRARKA